MKYLKTELQHILLVQVQTLQEEGFLPKDGKIEPELERPSNPDFGDYSCNFAMKYAQEFKRAPLVIAQVTADRLRQHTELLAEVKVARPGFINLYVNPERLLREVYHVRQLDERYGYGERGQGQNVLIEFVSANPVGPLNIVSARAAAVGDALARILASQGARVFREYYVNDAGRQALLLGQSLYARWQQAQGQQVELPEDGYQGDYVKELSSEIAQEQAGVLPQAPRDQAVRLFCQQGVAKMVESHRQDLAAWGVQFDNWFFESTLHQSGRVEQAAQALDALGYLYRQDGALWFRSTALGDDKDRVLKKANGDWAYLAADIAYHRDKFERGFNQLVDLWGPDHHGYIARLQAAMQALGYAPQAFQVQIVQQVNLLENGQVVAMSKRAGHFVTMQELIKEVGSDVARFFFLMRSMDAHLDFDLDLARQHTEANPVFYVQYAHARICSILKKASSEGYGFPAKATEIIPAMPAPAEELQLVRELAAYPEMVETCARNLEPHGLTFALRDIATAFHRFYTVCRVLDKQAPQLTQARLALIDACRIVLGNGLGLLGIQAPASM